VYVWNNTSIVQDEVLAQRLGLIPLAIDPEKLQAKACASLSLSRRAQELTASLYSQGRGSDRPQHGRVQPRSEV
jgi:DNA-directed RNA polymerase alpha subunit